MSDISSDIQVNDPVDPNQRTLHVALTKEGGNEQNILRRPRRLRIQLFDCRSGVVLPNLTPNEVLIDGEQAGRLLEEVDWDIVQYGWLAKKTLKQKDLVRALTALGYEPAGSRWKDLYPAMRLYREAYYANNEDQADEESVKGRKFRTRWRTRIIAEYRQSYYAAVQHHLTQLGYPCTEDKGQWKKKTSTKAYQNYQRIELGRKSSRRKKYLIDKKEATKLVATGYVFKSDKKGVFSVPISAAKIRSGFKVRVSLSRFPLVREEIGHLEREQVAGNPTKFKIVYEGPQNLDSDLGELGWHAVSSIDDTGAEFCRSVEFEIPACAEKSWKVLGESKPEAFQKFYRESKEEPEITLFAMRWCQPIWDGIENPEAEKRINEQVYIQKNQHRVSNMHVVTMYADLGGTDKFGGKGYGLYERRLIQRWRGKKIGVLQMLLRIKALGYFKAWVEATGASMILREEYQLTELSDNELVKTYNKDVEAGEGAIMECVQAYQRDKEIQVTGILNPKTRATLDKQLPRSSKYKDKKQGHAGYDLYVKAGNEDVSGSPAKTGSPVFALHGGSIKSAKAKWKGKGAGGNFVRINWSGPRHNTATYLHLDKLLVKKKENVRTGQIIGLGGNTGNFGRQQRKGSKWATKTQYPSHTHLNVGTNNKLWRKGPDDPYNRECLPHNGTPLLLPCSCEVPLEWANPENCKFGEDHKKAPNSCWAVSELRCPFIPETISASDLEGDSNHAKKAQRRVQAQLRYLYLVGGADGYQDPGNPDGNIGPVPSGRSRPSKSRKAIKAFRKTHKLPDGYDVDDAFIAELDALAVVHDHGYDMKTPDPEIDNGIA